jgi:hypothetical protein
VVARAKACLVMLLSFERVVCVLIESIVRERCADSRSRAHETELAVARFLLEVCGRMPDHARLVLRLLMLVFDAWAIPFTGRPFHKLPHEKRWQQVETWRRSAVAVRRDLIKFYETLAVFGWYSECYGEDYGAHRVGP